jgi:Ca2+/H+ antiporter, TMEM165/GDT1 family
MRFYRRKRNWFALIPLFIIGAALFAFLMGQVVMLLWNAILPAVFGVSVITFWQALGLLVLSRILFGGFFKGGRGGPHMWRRKWMNMSDEEKLKFQEEWKRRCGRYAYQPAETKEQPAE